jgi:hypothetical protein
MTYKGYEIRESSGGGKAGRGCNKTGTIQVREPFNATHYLLKKQIRFTVGDPTSRLRAVQKAREHIDSLVVKAGESKAAS